MTSCWPSFIQYFSPVNTKKILIRTDAHFHHVGVVHLIRLDAREPSRSCEETRSLIYAAGLGGKFHPPVPCETPSRVLGEHNTADEQECDCARHVEAGD